MENILGLIKEDNLDKIIEIWHKPDFDPNKYENEVTCGMLFKIRPVPVKCMEFFIKRGIIHFALLSELFSQYNDMPMEIRELLNDIEYDNEYFIYHDYYPHDWLSQPHKYVTYISTSDLHIFDYLEYFPDLVTVTIDRPDYYYFNGNLPPLKTMILNSRDAIVLTLVINKITHCNKLELHACVNSLIDLSQISVETLTLYSEMPSYKLPTKICKLNIYYIISINDLIYILENHELTEFVLYNQNDSYYYKSITSHIKLKNPDSLIRYHGPLNDCIYDCKNLEYLYIMGNDNKSIIYSDMLSKNLKYVSLNWCILEGKLPLEVFVDHE